MYLKEYLQIALDLEKHNFALGNTIATLESKHKSLGISQSFPKPKAPQRPQLLGGTIVSILLAGMAALGIYLFVLAIRLFTDGTFGDAFLSFLFLFPFSLVIAIASIIGFFRKLSKLLNESSDFDSEKAAYAAAESEYQAAVSHDASRVKEELAEKAALAATLEKLRALQKSCTQTLQKVYAENVIFPKYRSLSMVASLSEYISSGRCTTLEGPSGAYNILEQEIRLDRITIQLDNVLSKLDKIQATQYTLFSAVTSANHTSQQLLNCTYEIAEQVKAAQLQNQKQTDALITELHKSSALTAYQNERIHAELSYMNRMDYLTGRNKGPYDNLPPT